MEQGNIAAWITKEGAKINAGDIFAEIETDKATVEWECTEDTYVAKILVPEGAKDVPLGTPVIVTCENEEDIPKFADFKPSGAAPSKKEAKEPKKEQQAAQPPKQPERPKAEPAAAPPRKQEAPAAPSAEGGRVIASPLAKKLAGERGIDISSIPGTGPNQRIIAADVREYEAPPAVAAAPSLAREAGATYADLPISNIRKVTASRLLESKQTIPHYYLTIEARVDKLLKLREELNAKSGGKYKLSLNDFVVKASALALRKEPTVNSAWMETAIRRYNNVDINVAVNTPDGLFTPIVFDADRKGLVAISENVKVLAEKAKARKLAPAEFNGGTFTISNLGMYGITQFAAVINPPQAAILAVGSTQRRLIPAEDDAAKSAPYQAANYLTVTLSCDHRVVDGAVGAQWLQAFKSYLEEPMTMLL